MLGTCQQVGAARTNRAVFDVPCHPKHDDEAHVPRRHAEELWSAGFPSLPPSFLSLLLENRAAHCKKARKSSYLFVKLNYVLILLIAMYLTLSHLLS